MCMVPTTKELDTNNKTKIWERDCDKYYQDKNEWEDNKKRSFNLVLSHCPR